MPLRALFLHHFWLKLFSLGLATMLWFSVAGLQGRFAPRPAADVQTRTFVRLPITMMKSAADARGYHVSPSEVTVTLGGSAHELERLTGDDVEAFINLRETPSDAVFTRKVEVFLRRSDGVLLREVSPAMVKVERAQP